MNRNRNTQLKAIVIAFALVIAGFATVFAVPNTVSAQEEYGPFTVDDHTEDTGYTGDAFMFNATVESEDWAIDSVVVEYRFNYSETDYNTTDVVGLEMDDTYTGEITVPMNATDMEYTITITDIQGNEETTDSSSVVIHDNKPPEIDIWYSDVIIAGEDYNITANVTDNRDGVDEVWLNYTMYGEDEYNESDMVEMTSDEEPTYYVDVPIWSNVTMFEYSIWANDTEGNEVETSFPVFDGEGPIIFDRTGTPQTGEELEVVWDIVTNFVEVDEVLFDYELYYLNETGGEEVEDGSTNFTGGGTFNHTIDVVETAFHLNYTIWANDTSGVSDNVTVEVAVEDTIPPSIEVGGPMERDVTVGEPENFEITNYTDNLKEEDLNHTWYAIEANIDWDYMKSIYGFTPPDLIAEGIGITQIVDTQYGSEADFEFPYGGSLWKVVAITEDQYGNVDYAEFTVTANVEVNGTVVDSETGEPVPDAQVSFSHTPLDSNVSDENGNFSFRGNFYQMEPLTVVAHAEHYSINNTTWTGEEYNGTYEIELELEPKDEYTLTMGPVEYYDEEEDLYFNVPNAEVTLSNDTDEWSGTTDTEGMVSITLPDSPFEETFTLTIDHPDYAFYKVEDFEIPSYEDRGLLANPADETYTYRLEDKYEVSVGPVEDEGGNALAGADVSLSYEFNDHSETLDNETDEDGMVTFHVRADPEDTEFTVSVSLDGYEDAEDTTFTGDESSAITLEEEPSEYTITVGPIKDVNNKFVNDANVTLSWDGEEMTETSGTNGRYTFTITSTVDPDDIDFSYTVEHDDLDEAQSGSFSGTSAGEQQYDGIGEAEEPAAGGLSTAAMAGIGVIILIIIIIAVVMVMQKGKKEAPPEEEFEEEEFEFEEEEDLFEEEEEELFEEEEEDLFEEEEEELFEEEEELFEEEEELFEEEEELFEEEEEKE